MHGIIRVYCYIGVVPDASSLSDDVFAGEGHVVYIACGAVLVVFRRIEYRVKYLNIGNRPDYVGITVGV